MQEKQSRIDTAFIDEFYSMPVQLGPQSAGQLSDIVFSDLFRGLNIQPRSNYKGWTEVSGGFFQGDYVCSRPITFLSMTKNDSDDSLSLDTVARLRITCTIPWQFFPRDANISFEEIEPLPMNKRIIEHLANEVAR